MRESTKDRKIKVKEMKKTALGRIAAHALFFKLNVAEVRNYFGGRKVSFCPYCGAVRFTDTGEKIKKMNPVIYSLMSNPSVGLAYFLTESCPCQQSEVEEEPGVAPVNVATVSLTPKKSSAKKSSAKKPTAQRV
jgi:hypothetical protein